MILGSQNGYELYVPESGGKAGKGHNITSSLQVRLNNVICKQFRFFLGDPVSTKTAIEKAKSYIREATRKGRAT